MATRNIIVPGRSFPTSALALQWYCADPHSDCVLSIGGQYLCVTRDTATRLERAGIRFAYLYDVERRDGRHVTMSIPVNDK